jgi:polyisoprenoid-binding protein YceI
LKNATGVAALALSVAALPAQAAQRTYAVVPAESRVTVHVGRSGIFGFAGHEHEVVGPVAQGEVVADEADLSRATVAMEFDLTQLKVTGKGEPAEDVPKVQAKMLGPEALDVARHPKATFRSTAVSGTSTGPESWDVQVRGDLTLHGVTAPVTVALRVARGGGAFNATGRATIRHTDFGMKPISVAGVVKVKNELTLEFAVTARAP